MFYFAVVHKDEDSAFGISFPDVQGCFSAADEEGDIIANAIEALSLYFEDEEMVPASPISEIQKRAADDLKQGAFLVQIPYLQRTGRTGRYNVSLDTGIVKMIDSAARTRKMTRSAFLENAALKEIGVG
ncbi:type II toxin-antitoxin system HicB family antitoxin [Parasphingorhabdus sp.]|uniref:type II toxin-antitoxin system HicB family antitoxin n=1 Tax=Parasphingorhabdus sp. TaxID=2709688 RepID=UPI003A8CEFE3